ncbi:DUF4129 domain-containing protein [Cellvibrio sp. OA-2007]|uniref:DUF4129 domain-containing protein n=1 Tax=Cellvibrio sp. OA-2007 TaxID=529823 RepID=UPI000780C800|nr:DUF4129 domain-containing protein [Cellvibrio sp. OA-2007]
MNLDQVTIEIRPRSAWEALDLGLLMAKRWWLPMIKIWLLVSLPFFAMTQLLPANWFWGGVIFMWWLKPVLERPLLHILSHAVFNALPDTRSTFNLFPSLALKQIFASLTWRRLSPTRCMDLPVLQLEGLSGARRQDRLGVLHREDSSPAIWLTFMGFALELCLWVGMISFIWAFIPREIDIEWANLFFDQESAQLHRLQLFIWYCALSLTAPFYVACGFALYLNRRIKLEAWDIDIAFRRIANKRSSTNLLSAFVLVLTLGLSVFASDAQRNVYAEDQLPTMENSSAAEAYSGEAILDQPLGEYTELDRHQTQESIKAVLQQAEFSRKEIQRTLKFDKPEEEEDDEAATFWKKLFNFLDNFEGFVAAASLLEILLWVGVAALIGFVLYRYRHWLAAQFVRITPTPSPKAKPVTLFGMDVTRESLPEDISGNALRLLNTGDVRAALALLYRASLFHMIHSGIEIHDGHTEQECAELMHQHFASNSAAQTRVAYFAALTREWQRLAYGHLLPSAEKAQHLCANWNACWLQQGHSTAQGVTQ